uniref:Secreted protein n=1 Tax=Steinernema glaseri TaxID=37863 RepID=A0A1I7Z2G2_9BILA
MFTRATFVLLFLLCFALAAPFSYLSFKFPGNANLKIENPNNRLPVKRQPCHLRDTERPAVLNSIFPRCQEYDDWNSL